MSKMVEMVVCMESLADPMPIDFAFKVTNTDDIPLYVRSALISPPAGWTGSAEDHGALAVGIDEYFLNDNYTKTKPANLTQETLNFRISYYSDAGYTILVSSEDISYVVDFVDFDDVSFTVVDDDGFEVDLEGWTLTIESGTGMSLNRSTTRSRTGIASMMAQQLDAGDVLYAGKSFVIGAVTRAFIRVWMWMDFTTTEEIIIEIITDAGEVTQKRVLAIPFDANPYGGTEVCQQWVVAGLKLPVNGTYEVRLRLRCEYLALDRLYFDDIRVVQS